MDTSHILRIAHGLANEEIRSYEEKKSDFYFPRGGFSPLNCAHCIWRYYVEALSFQEVRRNLARCWSSNIARGLQRIPCADARDYLWAMWHIPTSEVIQKILPRAKFLYDEKTLLARETQACIAGHVMRADGQFRPPRWVNTEEKGGHRIRVRPCDTWPRRVPPRRIKIL